MSIINRFDDVLSSMYSRIGSVFPCLRKTSEWYSSVDHQISATAQHTLASPSPTFVEKKRAIVPELPIELWGEIGSYLPKSKALELRRLNRLFSSEKYVQIACKTHVDSMASLAIGKALVRRISLEQLPSLLTTTLNNLVTQLNVRLSSLTVVQLESLAILFPKIKTINFDYVRLSVDHIKPVAKFPNLQNLSIRNCNLNDEMLSYLTNLTKLEFLDISNVKVNTSLTGLHFDSLPSSLIWFYCGKCSITDEHLSRLQHLVNLKSLNIYANARIQGTTLHTLPSSLTDFRCSECQIPDANLAKLTHLMQLIKIDISYNKITGSTLDQLPAFLLEIILDGNEVTDENLSRLAHLTRLKKLDIKRNSTLYGLPFDKLPPSLDAIDIGDDPIEESIFHLPLSRNLQIFSNGKVMKFPQQ